MPSKRFTITFDQKLYQQVSDYAHSQDLTIAEVIRQASTQLVTLGTQSGTQSSPTETKHIERHLENLEQQIETKDQQIDKLQQALDQEQQLHAASQKTIESKQLQIEDMSCNRSILARIREVFIPSNT